MRALLLLAFVVALVPDREAPDPKEAKPLIEQIQGEWRLVKGVMSGREKKDGGETTITFTRTELRVREMGRDTPENAGYRIDEKMMPHHIDIMPKNGNGKKIEGIIRLDQDTLTICFAHDGAGARPTQFASEVNSPFALLHLQRIKK